MTEQPLIQALRAKVEKRIAAIEAEAEEEVREIEQDARAMMAEIRTQLEADHDGRYEEFRAAQQARHDNEQRGRQRELQHRLVEAVFKEVEARLGGVRERSDYPGIWQRLYHQARQRYRREDAGSPLVHCHPDDASLATECGVEEASVVPDALLSSGVVLAAPDQRFRVVNTPASRLQRGREEFAKLIADELRHGSS